MTPGARVLVVDDEPQLQRALTTNLKARGYEVDNAVTGEKALELAARHHPDVVILDLGLPGIDGIEVVRGLRGWSQVPILVLSARGGEAAKVAALDAGPTTTSRSRSAWTSCGVCVRARRSTPAEEDAEVVTADFTVDLANRRVRRDGRSSTSPTEWHVLEVLVRHPASSSASVSC
jgi:two-component system KDP operon response regulator KdpE